DFEGRQSGAQCGAAGGDRQRESGLQAGSELPLEGEHFQRRFVARPVPAEGPFRLENVIELAALLVVVIVASNVAGSQRGLPHRRVAAVRSRFPLLGRRRGSDRGRSQNKVSSIHSGAASSTAYPFASPPSHIAALHLVH